MKTDILTIGKITIHGYGLMIAIGILCCIAMGMYRAKKYKLNPEAVIDIALYGVLAGFLGAKLLYVIVEFPAFIKDPLSVLGSEGFVVYGGIILGVLAAIIYCRIKGLVFLEYFDLCAPSISLAQGFGRIGCFLAGCCYGRETQSFLGVVFPANSMAPAGVKHTGDGGALYMILYGVGRFLMEFLRADDRGNIGMLSTSQMISIVIVAGAVVLLWQNRRRDRELL